MKAFSSIALWIAAAAAALPSCQASNISVAWTIQSYANQTAQVGDSITFTWAFTHTVYIHPTHSCVKTGNTLLGNVSPVTYTFKKRDAGKSIYFACDIASHCSLGQHITIDVAPLASTSISANTTAMVNGTATPTAPSTVVTGAPSVAAAPGPTMGPTTAMPGMMPTASPAAGMKPTGSPMASPTMMSKRPNTMSPASMGTGAPTTSTASLAGGNAAMVASIVSAFMFVMIHIN